MVAPESWVLGWNRKSMKVHFQTQHHMVNHQANWPTILLSTGMKMRGWMEKVFVSRITCGHHHSQIKSQKMDNGGAWTDMNSSCLNRFWTDYEQLWTDYEQIMNRLWAAMNNLQKMRKFCLDRHGTCPATTTVPEGIGPCLQVLDGEDLRFRWNAAGACSGKLPRLRLCQEWWPWSVCNRPFDIGES